LKARERDLRAGEAAAREREVEKGDRDENASEQVARGLVRRERADDEDEERPEDRERGDRFARAAEAPRPERFPTPVDAREATARKTASDDEVARTSAKGRSVAATVAGTGVLSAGLTRARSAEPGTPPSRANANSMRDALVTEERPQNHIARIARPIARLPARSPKASRKIARGGDESAAILGKSWIPSVSARTSAYPAIALTRTAETMPRGARRAGSIVSSLTWAEAS